jgi:hypothetical protein
LTLTDELKYIDILALALLGLVICLIGASNPAAPAKPHIPPAAVQYPGAAVNAQ